MGDGLKRAFAAVKATQPPVRKVVEVKPHPANGQRNGGAVINTVFLFLECGHRKSRPGSAKVPKSCRCEECGRVK